MTPEWVLGIKLKSLEEQQVFFTIELFLQSLETLLIMLESKGKDNEI